MKCDRNRQRKERTPEERGILSDGLNEGEVVCASTDERKKKSGQEQTQQKALFIAQIQMIQRLQLVAVYDCQR